MTVDFEQECFFIAPIGEKGTEVRKRSDGVRDWIVRPAAQAAAGLKTLRADDVGEPGQITAQAVQHCLKAKAAVADLTGGNPNVYYELSVRHGALLPVVLVAEEGTKLPFDISQSRVIFFDHTSLSSAGTAKEELESQLTASLSSPPNNPISDGMRLAQLQAGNSEEQALGLMMDRLEHLTRATENINERLQKEDRRQEWEREILTAPPHVDARSWTHLRDKPTELSPDEMREILLERQMEDDPLPGPSAPDEDDLIRVAGDGDEATQTHGAQDERVGRNDPCWCGSGRKFKKCHGA